MSILAHFVGGPEDGKEMPVMYRSTEQILVTERVALDGPEPRRGMYSRADERGPVWLYLWNGWEDDPHRPQKVRATVKLEEHEREDGVGLVAASMSRLADGEGLRLRWDLRIEKVDEERSRLTVWTWAVAP